MNKKDLKKVQNCVEDEGFDYCFTQYSTFDEVKDEEFHRLVENYCLAHHELYKYIKMDEFYNSDDE